MGKPKDPPPEEFRLSRAEQEAVVQKWDGFAWQQARHWHRIAGGVLEDYHRAAVLGLWVAATRYDTRERATFSTYCHEWVKCFCRREAKAEAARGGRHPGSRNAVVLKGPVLFSEIDTGSPEGVREGYDRREPSVRDHRGPRLAAAAALAADLWAAVAELPPDQALALRLRYADGRSRQAVARAMGLTPDQAGALVAAAAAAMRERFPALADHLG